MIVGAAFAPTPARHVDCTSPRVALTTARGDRVLGRGAAHGRIPGTEREAQRERDGAIVVDGRVVVGRDGEVPGADSLAKVREAPDLHAPVCYAYRRAGCRHVTLVTRMDNVRVLREYERPIRLVGVMELTIASSLILGGVLASRGDDRQTTSGSAILITSGGVLAVVGLFQAFGGERNPRDVATQ